MSYSAQTVGDGIQVVERHGIPVHIVASTGSRGMRTSNQTMRTFTVSGYGSVREAVKVAETWRAIAREHGDEVADMYAAGEARTDTVKKAQKAVDVSAAHDAAKADVARAMRRYQTTWDYHGYANVYGQHITPSWRLVP